MKLTKTYNYNFSRLWTYFTIIFCLSLFYCNNGFAKTESQQDTILEEYKKLFTQQQKEFEKQRQIIAEQGKEIEKLKTRLDSLSHKPAEQQAIVTKKQSPSLVTVKKTDKLTLPIKPVGKAPPKSTEKQRLEQIDIPRLNRSVGGVLTRKGKLVIEPSLEYSYSDNSRVFLDAFTFLPAIAVGLIDLRDIKRNTFVGSLSTRYGITDRLEVGFRAPYVYRDDSQRSRAVSIGAGEDETFNADGNDIGDLEFSVNYQLNDGTGGWPIFIGNILATVPTGTSPFEVDFVQSTPGAVFPTELPTGSGYLSFQPSVSALYPTDPGVFFGNLSYNYNVETTEDVGKVDPGDAIGLNFGMGFSLNERSSFSLGYSQKHVFESEIDGVTIDGSELDIGQLLIGYSFRFSKQTNINLSLGIGTTDDAQDVRLNLRMPMTFDFLSQVSN